MNSVCNVHSKIIDALLPPLNEYVLLLNNFSHLKGVTFRPVGSWMDNISTDCCTCWAKCIGGVIAFSNGLWNIPTPVDQVLDVKIDALCEQE